MNKTPTATKLEEQAHDRDGGTSPPERIAGFRVHPAANLFPLMSEAEIQELAADIKANGQTDPITTYTDDDGELFVLDGRNRLLACEMAGVVPSRTIDGYLYDPVSFVLSKNLQRRHLTAEQRAAIVLQGAKLSGDLAKLQADAKVRVESGTQASREARGKTAAKLAEQAKVSRATVERVQAATKDDPKALDAIAKGTTTSRKLRGEPLDTRSDEEREADWRASPDLIEKYRAGWASLNATEAEAAEVERGDEMWREGLRILRAARDRVLAVYPKGASEIGPAAKMGGNLEDVAKTFRHLFETKGIGDGMLALPTENG